MLVNVYIPSNRASKQINQKGPKNKLDTHITLADVVKRERRLLPQSASATCLPPGPAGGGEP